MEQVVVERGRSDSIDNWWWILQKAGDALSRLKTFRFLAQRYSENIGSWFLMAKGDCGNSSIVQGRSSKQ